jgi:hypothetical protein
VKHIRKLVILCLLQGWLVACGNAPDRAEPLPSTTAQTQAGATATTLQSEPNKAQETVAVDDARFIRRSIQVDSAAVAMADFDADGHQDLVAAGEPQLSIFRGDGTGGLTRFSRVAGGEHPVGFALADLDEDGDVDIAVANHDTDYLTLLLGDGGGEFRPAPSSPLRIDVRPHPHAVRAADLDGDGHADLVVDHRGAEGLLVLRGLGDGRFETPGTLVKMGGDPYRGMAAGDIDGDGMLDLVTPNPREAGVSLNRGDGRIAFVPAAPVPAEAPFAVALGDLDGDTRLDLVAASDEGSALVELFLGDGEGGFAAAAGSPLRLAPGGKNIVVADFNGDSVQDAAVASYQFSDVLLLLGGGEGIRTGYLPGGEHPWGLAAADLNEDGKDDLVIADDGAYKATVYLSVGP